MELPKLESHQSRVGPSRRQCDADQARVDHIFKVIDCVLLGVDLLAV